MATPTFILPSAPTYNEGFVNGLYVYPDPTNFVANQIPFTRATTATRVNSSGLVELVPYNLVSWSEELNTSPWTIVSPTSITAIIPNSTISPSGAMNADTLVNSDSTNFVRQSIVLNISATYTASFYVKNINSTQTILLVRQGLTNCNIRINWSGTSISSVSNLIGISASFEALQNDWYRVTATFSALEAVAFYRLYCATTSESVYLWGAQLVEGTDPLTYLPTTTRLNIPRIDYSLGGCPNLLLEPQRTNLALYSEQFNVIWSTSASSITANSTISPSGVQNADTITGDGTFALHAIAQSGSSTNGVTYTHSIYAKKNTNNFIQLFGTGSIYTSATVFANFDLNLGVVGSVGAGTTATIQSVGNGWYRCTMTATATATATASFIYPCLITSATSARAETNSLSTSVFIWGAQLEAGAYDTSYIPTTSASVTRNADSFTLSNVYTNGLITSSGGTWFVELRNNIARVRDAGSYSLLLGDSTVALPNAFTIRSATAGVSSRFIIAKIVATVETNLYTTLTDTVKIAIKWNGTTADIFINGTKVVASTSYTPTTMQFIYANGNDIPKNINDMALWSTPLTDDQLELLTGDSFNTYAEMASFYNYTLQ